MCVGGCERERERDSETDTERRDREKRVACVVDGVGVSACVCVGGGCVCSYNSFFFSQELQQSDQVIKYAEKVRETRASLGEGNIEMIDCYMELGRAFYSSGDDGKTQNNLRRVVEIIEAEGKVYDASLPLSLPLFRPCLISVTSRIFQSHNFVLKFCVLF